MQSNTNNRDTRDTGRGTRTGIGQFTLTDEASPWAPHGLSRLTYTSHLDQYNDWALLLPGQSNGASAAAPATTWLVNLHGHGSTGDQLYTRADIRQRWLPHFIQTGWSIVSPNLRGNAWMSPAAAGDLHALLCYLREHHHAKQFVLVSGSMGGSGSLIYATQFPQDIAGVVALCPATDLPTYLKWTSERQDRPVIKQIHDAILQSYHHDPAAIAGHSVQAHAARLTMPVHLIHGDADTAIPVEQSRELAKAMADKSMTGNTNFKYTELPGGNHDEPLWSMQDALAWVRQRIG